MVKHKTGAEIRALHETLDVSTSLVPTKDQQLEAARHEIRALREALDASTRLVRTKDEQLEAARHDVASMKWSRNTFKMLFWGLLLSWIVRSCCQ